jgi:uncharacterized OB-fold protein
MNTPLPPVSGVSVAAGPAGRSGAFVAVVEAFDDEVFGPDADVELESSLEQAAATIATAAMAAKTTIDGRCRARPRPLDSPRSACTHCSLHGVDEWGDRVGRMAERVPLVDYLVLDDPPHLVANECTACGARFFDHRLACASCEGTDFRNVPVAREGEVRSFTIVSMAAPGIPVPFVAAVIDCDGTSVRGNVVNTEPDPDHVTLGMKVRLTTFPIGSDAAGTEAIGFGFEPLEGGA